MAFNGWPAEALEFFEGLEVNGHDELKTAPKGYPKDHPRIELLRYKGLVTWRSWPVEAWLGTAKAKQRIVQFYDQSRPVLDWLDRNVGRPPPFVH